MVEIVAGRIGEEIEQLALQVQPKMAQAVRDAARLDEFGNRGERMSLNDIGRRFQRKRAQHIGDCFKPRRIGVDPLGVARGKLRDLVARPAAAGFQITPVIQREEIRNAPLDDAQAMFGKPQVCDHLG